MLTQLSDALCLLTPEFNFFFKNKKDSKLHSKRTPNDHSQGFIRFFTHWGQNLRIDRFLYTISSSLLILCGWLNQFLKCLTDG